MMSFKSTTILFLLLFFCSSLHAQRNKSKFRFGDVKPEDFAPTHYAVDSSADAVFLYDIGSAGYEGNSKGFFDVVCKRHTRIRLLHKNAFDLATFSIDLYSKYSKEERLVDLDAATYNLEDGKVVVTKLDKSDLFKDKNKNYTTQKFTFPNVKEGSIIEYSYTVSSPYFQDIPAWYYQGQYPRLFSQYEVVIPEIFDFVFVKQGYHPYCIDTALISQQSYNLLIPGSNDLQAPTSVSWRGNTINSVWAMKDVPALKDESFTTTLANHVARISFQLSAIKIPEEPVKSYMHSWFEMAADLMKDEDFGAQLTAHNGWLSDDLKALTANVRDTLAKARKIYEYVRDNFTCIQDYGKYLTQPLRKTFQTRKGSVADLNLLLTAMYLNQGLSAQPVLLSTRSHGKALESYPLMDKFNYVICRLALGDGYQLLDASRSELGFGRLALECYNGSGRVIDAGSPVLVNLSADSLQERTMASVFVMNDSTGHHMMGSYTCTPGYFESVRLRSRLAKNKQEAFFSEIQKSFSWEVQLNNTGVDSLLQLDMPVSYHYDMSFDFNEDLVYFNPIIGDLFYRENPFKASTRNYPLEMDYCIDRLYVLNMEIPAGYKVEELPKSARVNLNENEGKFEYVIAADKNRVQMRCQVKLNKANFEPGDYETLRDFFAFIVKKEQEQVVFKKIKS